MKLIDANILLYAYDTSSKHHSLARAWLESELSGSEPVGFSWMTLMAFVRIGTNPRAVAHPFSLEDCCAIISSWLEQPNAAVLTPGEQHFTILRRLLLKSQARGPLAMDAHLAALALEHGATLVTNDRDFDRFDGLRTLFPLTSGHSHAP